MKKRKERRTYSDIHVHVQLYHSSAEPGSVCASCKAARKRAQIFMVIECKALLLISICDTVP